MAIKWSCESIIDVSLLMSLNSWFFFLLSATHQYWITISNLMKKKIAATNVLNALWMFTVLFPSLGWFWFDIYGNLLLHPVLLFDLQCSHGFVERTARVNYVKICHSIIFLSVYKEIGFFYAKNMLFFHEFLSSRLDTRSSFKCKCKEKKNVAHSINNNEKQDSYIQYEHI